MAILTWDGDAYDGIFNWLGTDGETVGFTNPSGVDYTASASGDLGGTPASKATDHLSHNYGDNAVTPDFAPNGWWKADFGVGHFVIPTYVGIVGDGFFTGPHLHPRYFKLQGSNDDSAWDDLLTVSGAGPESDTWWSSAVSTSTQYRYLRIYQTSTNEGGNHALSIGDIEFWGYYDETPFVPITDIRVPRPQVTQAGGMHW